MAVRAKVAAAIRQVVRAAVGGWFRHGERSQRGKQEGKGKERKELSKLKAAAAVVPIDTIVDFESEVHECSVQAAISVAWKSEGDVCAAHLPVTKAMSYESSLGIDAHAYEASTSSSSSSSGGSSRISSSSSSSSKSPIASGTTKADMRTISTNTPCSITSITSCSQESGADPNNNMHSTVACGGVDGLVCTEDDFAARGDTSSDPFALRAVGMLEKAGEGSFGEVYVGSTPYSGDMQAFKFVRLADEEAAERSEAEYCAMRLAEGSGNILTACSYVRHGSEVCTVMPFCWGGDVLDYAAGRFQELCDGDSDDGDAIHGVPECEVVAIARQALRGIAHIHSKRIIHMDIKPENLMLSRRVVRDLPAHLRGASRFVTHIGEDEACVKLTDFGLAVHDGESAEFKRMRVGGTVPYMAPEVLMCAHGDKRREEEAALAPYGLPDDIWSLGATIYLLLSGTSPRGHEGEIFCADALQFEGPCWREVSEALKDVVAGMMHPEPERRPTAAMLLEHPVFAASF